MKGRELVWPDALLFSTVFIHTQWGPLFPEETRYRQRQWPVHPHQKVVCAAQVLTVIWARLVLQGVQTTLHYNVCFQKLWTTETSGHTRTVFVLISLWITCLMSFVQNCCLNSLPKDKCENNVTRLAHSDQSWALESAAPTVLLFYFPLIV